MPTDYGFLSRLLHRVALGFPAIARASFEFEQERLKLDVETIIDQPHVFISGLARAGTTVLMRRFHDTGNFRSLTYADMPFVLMPNTWSGWSGSSHADGAEKERAHADGIRVGYESPEALEEVFWRVFRGKIYIGKDHLRPMESDREIISMFRSYVAAILHNTIKGEGNRPVCYLSKNNNNILRLPLLREAFPQARILIPFRRPLQHANSLLTQHRRFCEQHAKDAFGRRYMTWLAHHEFGSDHRAFQWNDGDPIKGTPEQLDYWLELWLRTYRYLGDNAPKECRFVCYETLCERSEEIWRSYANTLAYHQKLTVQMDFMRVQKNLHQVSGFL